jgi:hypothetical protein
MLWFILLGMVFNKHSGLCPPDRSKCKNPHFRYELHGGKGQLYFTLLYFTLLYFYFTLQPLGMISILPLAFGWWWRDENHGWILYVTHTRTFYFVWDVEMRTFLHVIRPVSNPKSSARIVRSPSLLYLFCCHWIGGICPPSTCRSCLDSVVMMLLQCYPSNTMIVVRATGWTVGVLDSRRGLEIFLFTTASRTALGPTQPPIQWVPEALSLGVKRSGREADYSPPSSVEVKVCVKLYLHSPIRLHGVVLS